MIAEASARENLEIGILSNIFQDNDLMNLCSLKKEHFYYAKHREIFQIMQELAQQGKEIDVMNVAFFDESKIEAIGGPMYLNQIVDSTPSTASFEYHQRILIEKSILSNASRLFTSFVESSRTGDITDLYKVKSQLDTILDGIVEQEQGEDTSSLIARRYEELQNTREGLSGVDTGFEMVNHTTDGWVLGDLIVVGARPSIGKTALTVDMMIKGVKNDVNSYGTYITCEMSEEQIVNRMFASNSNINLFKLRNAKKFLDSNDWEKLANTIGELSNVSKRFQIVDCYHVEDIRRVVRKTKALNPNKDHVFYIDHLDHVRIDGRFQSKHHEIGEIVHQLKQLARKENVAIVLLCQLSRGVESRQDKHPTMADLRESGTIEQVADVIILLYRDDYYNKSSKMPGVMELIIGKNRNGATKTVLLGFDRETSSFNDLEETKYKFALDVMKEMNEEMKKKKTR